MNKYTKWVACWGNATSITDRKECVYAKNLTLRYPVLMCFSGSKLRFRFSNLTGTEAITINKAFVAKKGSSPYSPISITYSGNTEVRIAPGKEIESDEVEISVCRGETVEVSMYMSDCTQRNAGMLII